MWRVFIFVGLSQVVSVTHVQQPDKTAGMLFYLSRLSNGNNDKKISKSNDKQESPIELREERGIIDNDQNMADKVFQGMFEEMNED